MEWKIVFVVQWIPKNHKHHSNCRSITKIEWKMKKRQTHDKAEEAMQNHIQSTNREFEQCTKTTKTKSFMFILFELWQVTIWSISFILKDQSRDAKFDLARLMNVL